MLETFFRASQYIYLGLKKLFILRLRNICWFHISTYFRSFTIIYKLNLWNHRIKECCETKYINGPYLQALLLMIKIVWRSRLRSLKAHHVVSAYRTVCKLEVERDAFRHRIDCVARNTPKLREECRNIEIRILFPIPPPPPHSCDFGRLLCNLTRARRKCKISRRDSHYIPILHNVILRAMIKCRVRDDVICLFSHPEKYLRENERSCGLLSVIKL